MDLDNLDAAGVQHEIEFWKGFVQSERFLGWCADAPTPELHLAVQALFISRRCMSRSHYFDVLDVGSGPVSLLHGLPGVRETTCDPLSPLYQQIVDYASLGIAPPLPYAAETVGETKPKIGPFPVVHCSNALDHTQDPEKAVRSMLVCVKKHGWLIIQGFADEADHEGYTGFHQHNLDVVAGNLTIRNKAGEVKTIRPEDIGCRQVWNYSDLLVTGRRWFVWVVEKQ